MRWCKAPSLMPRHKRGHTRNILGAFLEYESLSYYELWHLTGATRNQSARSVKYLRSVGHVFQTLRTSGGHCDPHTAVIRYVGKECDLF